MHEGTYNISVHIYAADHILYVKLTIRASPISSAPFTTERIDKIYKVDPCRKQIYELSQSSININVLIYIYMNIVCQHTCSTCSTDMSDDLSTLPDQATEVRARNQQSRRNRRLICFWV